MQFLFASVPCDTKALVSVVSVGLGLVKNARTGGRGPKKKKNKNLR